MARPGTHVRVAEPGDIADLVALSLEARGESTVGPQLCTPDPELLAEQLRLFASSEEGRILVVFVEEVLAGLLLSRFVGPGLFTDERAVHVEAIYVAAPFRRRGIGHALLAELGNLAQETGARHIYAVPLPGARGMQRFLARLGFAPAAAFRVVTLAALQRRLAIRGAGPRPVSRSRGLERLIARRRVASDARDLETQGAPATVPPVDRAG